MRECGYKSLGELRGAVKELGLEIPLDDDLSVLSEQVDIGDISLPNRLCVQPMECADADSDGAPSELTNRRYVRYAQGGFGLIWVEAVALRQDGKSVANQLCIDRSNLDDFKEFVSLVREAGIEGLRIIMQISHAGSFGMNPVVAEDLSDDEIEKLQEDFVETARLAQEAGFDGVDVKCCHGCLLSDLAKDQGNTGFLLKTFCEIRRQLPDLLTTVRLGVEDEPASIEKAVKTVESLSDEGLGLVNISVENTFIASEIGQGNVPEGGQTSEDEPLSVVARVMGITGKIQKAVPGVAVVGGSFSWLRQFAHQAAAGIISGGGMTIAGFGRAALANPAMANAITNGVQLDAQECCISCSACIQLLRDGGRTGCVMRDSDIYADEYRSSRYYAKDSLKDAAARCHGCADAPCSRACPAQIDVPGFIKAFEEDDIRGSYEILKASNVLPEMCSNLCPAHMLCEGACVEAKLSGNPVRIHDLQYAVSCEARQAGCVGLNVPEKKTGKKAAIVGCGPAGISAAVELIEKGHEVVIYEKDKIAGGTPELLIRASRYPGASEEVKQLLAPALKAGVLQVRYGVEVGKTVELAALKEEYDAVLVAGGLWKELPLEEDRKLWGVTDAVTFLGRVQKGEIQSMPERVALLAGGDCAMDAAVVAKELGAEELYIVYGGTLSEMHWHMEDSWFRAEGVHFMTLSDPVSYEESDGKLKGLKVMRVDPDTLDQIPDSEYVLDVDMVIEGIGLGVDETLKKELAGMQFSEYGLLETAGEDSFSTGIEGVFAAGGIINGGASVVQCISEGKQAAAEMHDYM